MPAPAALPLHRPQASASAPTPAGPPPCLCRPRRASPPDRAPLRPATRPPRRFRPQPGCMPRSLAATLAPRPRRARSPTRPGPRRRASRPRPAPAGGPPPARRRRAPSQATAPPVANGTSTAAAASPERLRASQSPAGGPDRTALHTSPSLTAAAPPGVRSSSRATRRSASRRGSSHLRRCDRAGHGQRQAHWPRGLVHELQDHRSARSVTHRGRPLDHVSAGHPHGCGRDRHGVHQPGPNCRLLCGDVPAVPGAHGPTDPPARPQQRDRAGAVGPRHRSRPGRRATPWAEGPPRPSTRGRLRGPPDQRWPAGSAWRRLTSGFRSSAGGRAGRDRPPRRGAPPR